ncbi:unnamed protein product [Calicophoron daubneyi]|uniref:Uncharacterized protein n=1 Tax=Calicophoron daubneyi TaxID=300641 RepID=A0AAV2TJ32_CALDB
MRKHTKPGKERQCRPRVAWDYRYHAIPESYLRQRHASSGPCRGDQSILTLRGHTVRFSLIRARFSPKHSTGQRFAYSGSASGAWHIWDLFTGKLTRTNSVGSESIRDVYWHPWEPLAIASGMDGSLTCWKYRREKGLDDKGSSPTSDHERFNNATDERANFLSVDPRGERYSLRLAESGLRYRFPGEHLQILPSSDSGSSHSDLEDYHDEYLLASETDESTSNDSSYEGFLSGRCELASDDEEDPDFNINAFADSNSLPSTNSPSRMVTRSQSRPRGGTESIRRRAHLGRRSGTTGHSS